MMDFYRIYDANVDKASMAFSGATIKTLQNMGIIEYVDTEKYVSGQTHVYVHFYRKVK
jgi:hypothetical protein